MSKTSLFWFVFVITVSARVAAAEEFGDRSIATSLTIRVPPTRYGFQGNPLQEHQASVVTPEPYAPLPPGPAIAPPEESHETVPAGDEQSEGMATNACRECRRGTCSRCRPSAGDRVRVWWAYKKACLQWSHWGYPEYFEARPFGASVCASVEIQVANGMAARRVLYQYDFYEGTLGDPSRLNPHGQRRLHEIVAMLQCKIWPVIIEPAEENPELDSARRAHVLKLLHECMGEIHQEWVVVADPRIPGLCGEEAVEIYENLLRQTRIRGSSAAAGQTQRTTITTAGPSSGEVTDY